MKNLYVALFLILNSIYAIADEPKLLNCQEAPGGIICRKLKTLESQLKIGCTGEACYSLFAQQESSLRSFNEFYSENIFVNPKVEKTMAEMTYGVARTLCGYEWTGLPHQLSGLILQANQALDHMLEIQVGGELKYTKHCKFNIH